MVPAPSWGCQKPLPLSLLFGGDREPAHSREAARAALPLLLKSWDLSIRPFVFEKTGDTSLCSPANCRELERQNLAMFANCKYLETCVQTGLMHQV